MFKLTVATPEKRIVLNEEVTEVTVPAFAGELNILPGHAPLITTLESGELKWIYKQTGNVFRAVISWGYCQVSPQGVSVLAEIVDLPSEIEEQEVKDSIRIAEAKLLNQVLDDTQYLDAARELRRAQAKQEMLRAKNH